MPVVLELWHASKLPGPRPERLLGHMLLGPPRRVSDSVGLGIHLENPAIPGNLGEEDSVKK